MQIHFKDWLKKKIHSMSLLKFFRMNLKNKAELSLQISVWVIH
jgi:hypothetical protein